MSLPYVKDDRCAALRQSRGNLTDCVQGYGPRARLHNLSWASTRPPLAQKIGETVVIGRSTGAAHHRKPAFFAVQGNEINYSSGSASCASQRHDSGSLENIKYNSYHNSIVSKCNLSTTVVTI